MTDTKLGGAEPFVLKRLKNPNRLSRFSREVSAISGLTHPNIVTLIDHNLETDHPYLVTEYCRGGSLDNAQPYWQESPVKALKVFGQVCSAVAHAHQHNVIHRDIKPANVFLRSPTGPAVLGDFGLCLLEEEIDRFTQTTEAVGPRLFMAPELEDGRLEGVPKESDVYSLGKLLYWLMSKGRMFSREKHRELSWDLKGHNLDSITGWNDMSMEHVNRLLDLMVVLSFTLFR